ncbi:MAG: helix-turn-helix domain-containing protein [Nitrospinae bacterium]|nr:helix-turn-helix domain-containing protein [Nitrospinota bacterium]
MKRKKIAELDYYELLNIQPRASQEEVERAYLYLASVYSENSRAAYGAISEAERQWMIKRVQLAFETLINPALRAEYDAALKQTVTADTKAPSTGAEQRRKRLLESFHGAGASMPQAARQNQDKSHVHVPGTPPPALNTGPVTGAHLKNIRLAKGASLDEISSQTKVKKSYLEAIEREDSKSFPAPVFMKGFLKAYAKALGLDPEEISVKYLNRE